MVILGMAPLARSCTRRVRTDILVTLASGLIEVRANSWRKRRESRSGTGADVGFRERVARRTCPSVTSRAGGKSVGMKGCVGAFREG